jgi:hypothetical protein
MIFYNSKKMGTRLRKNDWSIDELAPTFEFSRGVFLLVICSFENFKNQRHACFESEQLKLSKRHQLMWSGHN